MAGPVSNYSDEIAAAMAEAEKQSRLNSQPDPTNSQPDSQPNPAQLNPQPDPSTGLPYAPVPQVRTEADDMARIGRFLRPSTMVVDRRNDTLADQVLKNIYYTFRGTHTGGRF